MTQVIVRRPDGDPTGRPILFVHGAWHGAWCWEPFFLDWFAERGHVATAVGLRGHGGAGFSPGTASIADYVRDVAAAVRAFDEPPVVVGHSMGGHVVQRLAEGVHLPGIALLAPSPVHGAWQAAVRVAALDPAAFARINLERRLGPVVEDPATARALLFRDGDDRPEVDEWLANLCDESYRAFIDLLTQWPRPSRVRAPVLVVAGGADRIFSVAEQRATAEAHDARLVVIRDAAHDLMLDPAWERAAEAIETWLEDLG